MSIIGKLWDRAKETPDERRLRQRREAKQPKGKRKKLDPVEHFEVDLQDGRTIRW